MVPCLGLVPVKFAKRQKLATEKPVGLIKLSVAGSTGRMQRLASRTIEPEDPPPKRDSLEIADQTCIALVEALTGIAASDKKEWALSIGHLAQRIRGVGFLRAFIEEFRKYREKGRIKPDCAITPQSADCLQELLDSTDRDSLDEVRFNAIKAISLTAALETHSDRNSILPQQLLRICRRLTSTDIVVLKASYELVSEKGLLGGDTTGYAAAWVQEV